MVHKKELSTVIAGLALYRTYYRAGRIYLVTSERLISQPSAQAPERLTHVPGLED